MENLKIDNNDYVKLPRSIKTALVDGFLRFEEYSVLVWLWINANPRNGRAQVSYAGLSQDFKEKYSKNMVNRLMLNLKRKKWIWFAIQQGRRSSFNVDIASYPLSDGTFMDIEYRFQQKSGRSQNVTDDRSLAEVPTEVGDIRQKLKDGKNLLIEQFSLGSQNTLGRSPNNDNEKENNNKRSTRQPVRNFNPKTYEDQRCWEIAKDLGEKDMAFILSALKKHGLTKIESVYQSVMDQPNDKVKNKGAYFNTLLNL